MENQILEHLRRGDYIAANVPELLDQLGLPRNRQQELQRVLRALEQAGRIARIKGNRYILPAEADLIPGRIRINRAGKGFLQPDDSTVNEIVIPESATHTALDQDRVLVRRDRPESRNTGTVIRVLERHRTKIVGTLQKSSRFLFVIPDDPRIPHDVYVPEPMDVGRRARVGDKVVVELREWESRHSNPEGEIVEILGAPDEEGVDMLSVLRQYDLPLHFPKNVLAEARAFGNQVSPHELHGREDCRSHPVVTIDPDDAKDFDDAICLRRISAEQWKLWVHIADVSHYVKPGTALDDEARKRGNSTYLVDRVIPMLPEALSNELCSLKPAVDRLTKCVEFLVSHDGRVLETKFYPAVIHSQRRFAYREVLAILQRKPEDNIERMLHDANELAQRIRRLRFKAGSLDLDFPESKIRLDENGRIARIERVENDISHQLIEEYMLLANEAVAARLMGANINAIYRVHEEPDERRLREYREEVLSHHVPCGNLKKREEVQKLLHKLGTLPIGQALKIGLLKSLMRARYDVQPLGHYGLAKKNYTHFTSPIRRYADLVVHRALFEARWKYPFASLKETAEHISATERNSADAERDSKDVKLFAYLKAQIASGKLERYPALVTDLRNFGFFVDVSGLAMSGLVPLSTMDDDFYIYDEIRNHLIGRRTRRIIRLGDKVEVQVAKVDTFKKQVDFFLASKSKEMPKAKVGPSHGHLQDSSSQRHRRKGRHRR
ncbi:MAG TPA: ribonuclease R [Verrucomicrobiae bacterium]|nr:ribonuclease R [Verrucomicrobiae bacterium]